MTRLQAGCTQPGYLKNHAGSKQVGLRQENAKYVQDNIQVSHSRGDPSLGKSQMEPLAGGACIAYLYLGPDRGCSPRHRMSINSRNEGSKCIG